MDIPRLSIPEETLQNLGYNDLSNMALKFGQVMHHFYPEDYTFERVLELIEGHHLTEQEQKASARDRSDLLIERLEASLS